MRAYINRKTLQIEFINSWHVQEYENEYIILPIPVNLHWSELVYENGLLLKKEAKKRDKKKINYYKKSLALWTEFYTINRSPQAIKHLTLPQINVEKLYYDLSVTKDRGDLPRDWGC